MSATDLALVRRWLESHDTVNELTIAPHSSGELRDIYFDTDDWRIFRSGYALRTRAAAGHREATLKSLRSAREDVADRREINEPLNGGEDFASTRSSGPVSSRIRAVAAGQPLRALFEVLTLRERFAIRHRKSNEALGEIALDESAIFRREGEPIANLRRVEVEALCERRAPLEKVVALLKAECALKPARESKYELGLKSVGLAPAVAPQLATVTVNDSMRASDAALARLRELFIDWCALEPGARLGDDTACLHDLRTAVRRMDGALSLYGAYLPAALVRSRGTVKALVRAIGAVRDLDVQRDELERFSQSRPAADRSALEPLREYLASQRLKARSRMLARLDSKSTRRWLERSMTRLAQPSPARAPQHEVLAVVVAPELIGRRFRKLRKAYRRLDAQSSAQDYHAVRRQVKRLRYAIESIAPIYGKPAERALRSLRRLQKDLGRHQDAAVAQRMLLDLASAPSADLSARTLFMMGRFAEECSITAAHARDRIGKSWRKVRRRWKALRASLEDLRDRSPRAASGLQSDEGLFPVKHAAAPHTHPAPKTAKTDVGRLTSPEDGG